MKLNNNNYKSIAMFKRTIIPAVVAVFAMVACSKGFQESAPVRVDSTEGHSLSVGIEAGAYLPADETRATMEAVVRVNWEKGDQISVVNATTGKLLGGYLEAEKDGDVVTFKGTVYGNVEGRLYYIYPRIKSNTETEEEDFGEREISSLAEQDYYGDETGAGRVCFHGYAEETSSSTSTDGSYSQKSIKFNLVTAYVHLNMSNLPAEGSDLTSVKLSNVNSGFKWVCNGGTVKAAPLGIENLGISVTCHNATISETGNAVVRFAVPASPATQDARVLTVNDAYVNSNYTKAKREPAKYYNQLYSSWKNNVTVEDNDTSQSTTEVLQNRQRATCLLGRPSNQESPQTLTWVASEQSFLMKQPLHRFWQMQPAPRVSSSKSASSWAISALSSLIDCQR